MVGAPDRCRRDAVLSGEGRSSAAARRAAGWPKPPRPSTIDDRAAALDDLRLGLRVDAAVFDRLDVRGEPADAVRVVPAQVRLHERLGDRLGGRRRGPGVLEDGAGQVRAAPLRVYVDSM